MGVNVIRHQAGARVSVEINWDAPEPQVRVELYEVSGAAPEHAGQSAWEDAAMYGVEFALAETNTLPCAVTIVEICGDEVHTNPTVIAAASAHAVWEALEFEPSNELRMRVEAEVRLSRHTCEGHLVSFAD